MLVLVLPVLFVSMRLIKVDAAAGLRGAAAEWPCTRHGLCDGLANNELVGPTGRDAGVDIDVDAYLESPPPPPLSEVVDEGEKRITAFSSAICCCCCCRCCNCVIRVKKDAPPPSPTAPRLLWPTPIPTPVLVFASASSVLPVGDWYGDDEECANKCSRIVDSCDKESPPRRRDGDACGCWLGGWTG